MFPLRKFTASVRIFLLFLSLAPYAQAQTSLADAFPGMEMEPELRPLMEQFLTLAMKAHIQFPLKQRIARIEVLPHTSMMNRIQSRGNIQAVAILDARTQETVILLSEELRSSPVEMRILLFHELLHAAGYNHPHKDCHWAEVGCGIMGRSPYPHLRMSVEHGDEVIRKSFKPGYLQRLPRIEIQG